MDVEQLVQSGVYSGLAGDIQQGSGEDRLGASRGDHQADARSVRGALQRYHPHARRYAEHVQPRVRDDRRPVVSLSIAGVAVTPSSVK